LTRNFVMGFLLVRLSIVAPSFDLVFRTQHPTIFQG